MMAASRWIVVLSDRIILDRNPVLNRNGVLKQHSMELANLHAQVMKGLQVPETVSVRITRGQKAE